MIIEANFTELQGANAGLIFWMHYPELAGHQYVISQGLYSKLLCSFKQPVAINVIDSFGLRSARSSIPEQDVKQAQRLSNAFIETLSVPYGENQCCH